MNKVYAIPVDIHATMYVRATNEKDAGEKAKEACANTSLLLSRDNSNDIEISGRAFDDPALPEVSLSPAMMVGDPEVDSMWEAGT